MKIIAIVLALLVIGGAAYLLMSPGKSPLEQFNNNESVPTSIDVSLNDQNNSGELGMATITEVNGKAVVSINVKGGEAKVAQPAHIHLGSCSLTGEVKYPLSNVVDGVSETTLDIDMKTLKANLPLLINVHKSETESSVYVTCGDVKL